MQDINVVVASQVAKRAADLERANLQLAVMYRIAQAVASTLDVAGVLAALLEGVRTLTGAELALVGLLDAGSGEITICRSDGPGSGQMAAQGQVAAPALARQVLAAQTPALHTPAAAWLGLPSPQAPGAGMDWAALGLQDLICVPLIAGGQAIGVVEAFHSRAGTLAPAHVELLQALAAPAAVAIQNARLYQSEREQRQLAETLREAGAALVSSLDADTILDRLLEYLGRIVAHDATSVMLVEGEHVRVARWRGLAGLQPGDVRHAQHLLTSSSLFTRMLATGQPSLIADTRAVPGWPAAPAMSWFRSWLSVPIRARGAILGFLNVNAAQPHAFDAGHVERLSMFADQVAIALENARLYEQERAQYRRLEQSQAQLIQAEKLAVMGRLAASFAHEINNPLQAIRSHLELIMDYPLSEAERAENLGIAWQEIQRLSETARRVLNFYRPAETSRTVVPTADLLQRTLALVKKQVQRGHIEVKLELLGDSHILASIDQLVQVFLNLMLNAIEALVEGGHIHIREYVEGRQVRITFANDGPPIAPENLLRVFEPFFSTKSDGTGLGLAISYNLVEAHSGSLAVANLPDGSGVIFTISLPLAEAPGQAGGGGSANDGP